MGLLHRRDRARQRVLIECDKILRLQRPRIETSSPLAQGILRQHGKVHALSIEGGQPAPRLQAFHPVDQGQARRVALYELLAVMLWLGLMVERVLAEAAAGPVRRWAMNTMPANERGRRFLARALAWPEGDFEAAYGELSLTNATLRSLKLTTSTQGPHS